MTLACRCNDEYRPGTRQAQSQKDAEGKARGWVEEAEPSLPDSVRPVPATGAGRAPAPALGRHGAGTGGRGRAGPGTDESLGPSFSLAAVRWRRRTDRSPNPSG